MTKPGAIIVGRGYNALSIVWALSHLGVPCTVFADKRMVAGWSRHARFVRCPNAASDEQQFQSQLLDLCRSHQQPPVVIPTNDKWASAIAKMKDRLTAVARPCVADTEVVELLLDKSRFSKLGIERGYLTLPSFDATAVRAVPVQDYPLVAKPNLREVSSNSPERIGLQNRLNELRLTVLSSPGELDRFLSRNEGIAPHLIFQPLVAGDCSNMYSICVYADQSGDVIGLFAGRKVRGYPPNYGDCVRGETWQAPPDMVALAKRICRELGYHGIAELEFKRDVNSGKFFLIEINPRSWSWIGITPLSGANLPRIAYEHMASGQRKPADSLHIGNGALAYGFVLAELLGAHRYKGNPFHATMTSILSDYSRGSVACGDLSLKDPLVTLMGFLAVVRGIFSRRQ